MPLLCLLRLLGGCWAWRAQVLRPVWRVGCVRAAAVVQLLVLLLQLLMVLACWGLLASLPLLLWACWGLQGRRRAAAQRCGERACGNRVHMSAEEAHGSSSRQGQA